MSNTYEIYLVSDSTGETLERIFLAIKAQFKNFNYKTHYFSFTRTENQILKIIENSAKNKNSIFLYTIVDNKLAQFLSTECNKKKIPCFGVLGDLILTFSKLLNQEASHIPSGQHVMNDDYYKKIDANVGAKNKLLDVIVSAIFTIISLVLIMGLSDKIYL